MEPYSGYVLSAQPYANAGGTFSAYGVVSLRRKIATSSGRFETYAPQLKRSQPHSPGRDGGSTAMGNPTVALTHKDFCTWPIVAR
jgi:hypothetical protein